MNILVLNSGSSSLKYKFFDMATEKALLSGHIDGIGLERCLVKMSMDGRKEESKALVKDHVDAIILALKSLKDKQVIGSYADIHAIGHRVVHGGEKYEQPTLIDEKVIRAIKQLFELAPLHNPPNLAGILACRKILPSAPQVAVFDTAFHQSMPPEAYLYGLPYELYEKHRIRKYGFHGTSHKYLSEQAAKLLGKKEVKVITCHLGNGSSITAIKDGKSINTSMGFTPMDGLIMGTRTGSIDPQIPVFLLKHKQYSLADMQEIFNKKSGLFGISGLTHDVRDLWKASVKGNSRAKLALSLFCHRAAFFIGGYIALLGGIDALVFSAGIGENAWHIRRRICKYLEPLGVEIDTGLNRKNNSLIISKPSSKAKIFVIPTNEELQIARETKQLILEAKPLIKDARSSSKRLKELIKERNEAKN
ncbi:acetate kinase [Candidatus Woesearchaeota archaeon]|nr:acetate kinase [Candidatus Woesearchaeota archaeon]